jgi:3',5'-cyclic AMP phosphodiesterase CpdA
MVAPGTRPLRIVHLSDIHIWRYSLNPLRLLSKRMVGMASLILARARHFRLERMPDVIERVRGLHADHILITGDVTTTALPAEFHAARVALAAWLHDPARVTIIPGNHDRYTFGAHLSGRFERYLGAFSAPGPYPWLRMLDTETAILGLDPTRAGITARGKLPRAQLKRARDLVSEASNLAGLLIACHYPVAVPSRHERGSRHKRLVNAREVGDWLRTIGPHVYCCGHVHATWGFQPDWIPNELCLNPGAPLLRDRTGQGPPGFFEILLERGDVTVEHHFWTGTDWGSRLLHRAPGFFPRRTVG